MEFINTGNVLPMKTYAMLYSHPMPTIVGKSDKCVKSLRLNKRIANETNLKHKKCQAIIAKELSPIKESKLLSVVTLLINDDK